jgi:hypothetical protein
MKEKRAGGRRAGNWFRNAQIGPGEADEIDLAPLFGICCCMVGENGFPRRKRAGRAQVVRDPQAAPKRLSEPPAPATSEDAVDVARYVTDMTSQLEAMASAAHLDLLAYFLGMAKAEAELFVRTHVPDQGASADTEDTTPQGMD